MAYREGHPFKGSSESEQEAGVKPSGGRIPLSLVWAVIVVVLGLATTVGGAYVRLADYERRLGLTEANQVRADDRLGKIEQGVATLLERTDPTRQHGKTGN